MNLAQAQAEVVSRGFDYLPSDRITLMLNDAKNVFEDYWPWPWLQQVKRGPAPLAIVGLKHVLYVQDTDHDSELLGLHAPMLAQNGTPLDQPGTPEYWWLSGPAGPDDTVTVNVWPVQAVALEAGVIAESPELVNSDDTPLIPARYHPIWIDLAVVSAYRDSDNFPAAGQLQATANTRLSGLVERYETVNRQHAVISAQRTFSEDD